MQYIYKGQYNSFAFTIENCDGSAFDLSNYTVKFIVKKAADYEDAAAVILKEIANSDTNNIMFDMVASETAGLVEGSYVMAIKAFKDNGVNFELWSDKCMIIKGVFDE